ncbi:MAG TPA: LPS assembly lipoprotein LptE [Cyclobacteriaceae bacterium]|nr:LPS assembly lipoprotein LptE [Cyclobacteriaceae bacterium]
MKNNIRILTAIVLLASVPLLESCYSLTGISTNASSIQVEDFFNNTELGPANLGPNFTNRLKDYYQRNSSLKVVPDNGELSIEGTITDYRLTPVAPVSSGNNLQPDAAAFTRLTISVKANYVDTAEPKNSFKDKTFSFYADFPNEQDLLQVQESLERKIFDQIMLDIFNATIATW